MFAARQLKRKGKIFATWSDAGKLKVRVTAEASTVVIKSLEDLRKLVGDDPALEPSSTDSVPGPASASHQAAPAAADTERSEFQEVAGRGRGGRRKK